MLDAKLTNKFVEYANEMAQDLGYLGCKVYTPGDLGYLPTHPNNEDAEFCLEMDTSISPGMVLMDKWYVLKLIFDDDKIHQTFYMAKTFEDAFAVKEQYSWIPANGIGRFAIVEQTTTERNILVDAALT